MKKQFILLLGSIIAITGTITLASFSGQSKGTALKSCPYGVCQAYPCNKCAIEGKKYCQGHSGIKK